MEITSKPTALDEINRSVLKLEMERLSLMNDTDKASKDRLSRLDIELSLLKKKQAELTEQWEHEKSVMTCIQSIKEEVYFHHEYLSEVKLSLQHILDNSEDSSVAHCHTYKFKKDKLNYKCDLQCNLTIIKTNLPKII
jgi:ATP-dependent Clp protease ATP-binding subunit ClpA